MRAILTYHSIDETGSPISVDPATFRGQIEWLARHGPPVCGVAELLRLPPTASAVALTFDDALVNFASAAWPVLRDHDMAVTLFVPTALVGGSNRWSAADRSIPAVDILGWPALERLVAAGVAIGSHTRTHPRLPRLALTAIEDELHRSHDELEQRLGMAPAGLAYPYGAVDARAARTAADIYDYACTTELRPLGTHEDPHRLPRIDAYYLRAGERLRWWGSSRLRMYLHARNGARTARALLAGALGGTA